MFDLAINTSLDPKPKLAAQALSSLSCAPTFALLRERVFCYFRLIREGVSESFCSLVYSGELRRVPSISDALELYCDNNGAIAQAKEPRSHQRSKHILRRFHLIREIVDRGDVEICKVHTDDNIADPLTKPLSQQKHDRHTESLGIRYVSEVLMLLGDCWSKPKDQS
ncbi:hypothetical protein V6N12_068467 [Hibiscus sabdariffa]|uniref:Uncharacterized protein n=1 Tax=Hibiscus sabdariffa TaxID=183260 RepID=A0ABR2FQ17_9ROSI